MFNIQTKSFPQSSRGRSRSSQWVTRSSALTIALASAYATPGIAQTAQPAAAAAQSTPAASEQLDVVVVTARRVAEKAQEIPASIAAVTGAKVENMASLADIQSLVSGVTFKTFGPIPTVGIRGYGNRTVAGNNTNSTVGIFQDGVFIAPPLVVDVSRIDTERVEVAKGPQSTLYGRSSFTGAINIVSNDPAKVLSGYVDMGIGSSSVDGDHLFTARAAVSIPLNDTLAVRFFALREKRDGYTYDTASGNRGNSYDREIGRVKFLWKPNEDFTARFTGTILNDNLPLGMVHTGLTPAPYGSQVFLANNTGTDPKVAPALTFGRNVWDATGSYVLPPSGKTKGQQATLDLRYQTPFGELVSLTDVQHSEQDLFTSLDLTSLNVARGETPFEERRWSQELRLSNEIGAWTYQLGAYYLHAKNEQSGNTGPDLAHPSIVLGPNAAVRQAFPFITNLYSPSNLETKAYALFGQVGYDFTKQLNLTVGLRQGREELSGSTGSFASTGALGLIAQQAMTFRSATFESTTGSANLSYKFAPEIVGYASYAKGNSPGGFNGGVLAATNFAPQKVDAYEIGLKSQLLDRRLQLNVALFNNEYSDIQITQNQIINGQFASRISNAGDARGRGLDVDATAILSKQWRLGLQYTHAKSEITRYQLTPGALPVDFTGAPLVRSPEDSLNASVTFKDAVGPGKLSVTLDESYTSSYTNDYQGLPATATTPQQLALYRTPGYATTNLSANYAWGAWEVNGSIRNLFNRQYIASVLSFDAVSYPQELPGEPRTYQVSVKYKF